jgi:hypothetical protein
MQGRHLIARGGQGRFDEAAEKRLAAESCRPITRETPLENSTLQPIQIGTVRIVPEPANPCRVASMSQQEAPMAAAKKSKTARGRKQDRARVAGGQDHEVQYEAKKTGKSAPAVKKAVKKVGNARKRVEKRLGR